MALTGMHALLYSSAPDELRAVLRDVLGLHHVDAGGGWLIFRLPPSEIAVHPADAPRHEVSFMCDDIEATVADLRGRGVDIRGDIQEQGWGRSATMVLPGELEVLLYEPRHATAIRSGGVHDGDPGAAARDGDGSAPRRMTAIARRS